MTHMVGMNVDEVRALSRDLRVGADHLESIVHEVTARIWAVNWIGRDASLFQDEWERHLKINLLQVSRDLSQAALIANRNVAEQEAVSNA